MPGCVQTDILSGNHTGKSAGLIRLLTLIIEIPRKEEQPHKKKRWKRKIVSNREM